MSNDEEVILTNLPDGRTLEVNAAGPADGVPLLFHHGTPGSAMLYAPMVEAATDRGLRMVSYSRPGYGLSTPRPGRSVADVVTDVVAVADVLGADRFLTVGWSGGGPYALACAALLPDRCAAAVPLSGVAPYGVAGLEWMAGMGEENVHEFSLALQDVAVLTPWIDEWAKQLAHVGADDVAAALGSLVSDVDKSALTGDFAAFLAANFRHAVSTGIAGWRDDDLAGVRDWGFEVGAIQRPVSVWQGGEDRMVPFAHGVWLAEHVQGTRRHLHVEEGHLSLAVSGFPRILDDLVDLAHLS